MRTAALLAVICSAWVAAHASAAEDGAGCGVAKAHTVLRRHGVQVVAVRRFDSAAGRYTHQHFACRADGSDRRVLDHPLGEARDYAGLFRAVGHRLAWVVTYDAGGDSGDIRSIVRTLDVATGRRSGFDAWPRKNVVRVLDLVVNDRGHAGWIARTYDGGALYLVARSESSGSPVELDRSHDIKRHSLRTSHQRTRLVWSTSTQRRTADFP